MNYPHLMKIVILASGVMIAGSIVMLTAEMSRHHRFETCSYLEVRGVWRTTESGERRYKLLEPYQVLDYRLKAAIDAPLAKEIAAYCDLEVPEQ